MNIIEADIVGLLEKLNVKNLGVTYAQSPVSGSAYGYDTHSRLWLTIQGIIVFGRRFISSRPMNQTIAILHVDGVLGKSFIFHPHFLKPEGVTVDEVLNNLESLLYGRTLRVEHGDRWTKLTLIH